MLKDISFAGQEAIESILDLIQGKHINHQPTMKKILAFITVLICALSLNAQNQLSIMGIPIEGSMVEFSSKMQRKGFSVVYQENEITLFRGEFTGRNATIGVNATEGTDNVYALIVYFDSSEEWNTLVSTYEYYKKLYSRKYGAPSYTIEENPAAINSNVYLMHELEQGNVLYGCEWQVENGDIEIRIDKASQPYEGCVRIRYRNTKNLEEKIDNDLDEI